MPSEYTWFQAIKETGSFLVTSITSIIFVMLLARGFVYLAWGM